KPKWSIDLALSRDCLLRLFKAFQNASTSEQRGHGIRRLSAIFQPTQSFLLIDMDSRRLDQRIVPADILDNSAIAGRTGIGNHNTIARGLFLPHSFQANLYRHVFVSLTSTPSASSLTKGFYSFRLRKTPGNPLASGSTRIARC